MSELTTNETNLSDCSASCMICLESVNMYIIANSCNCKLYVHENCFQSWINLYSSCLICKSKIHNFNKIFKTKIKYFNDEFENSKLVFYLVNVMAYVTRLSEKIDNEIIRYLMFNMLFGCFVFFIFMMIVVYIAVISQSRYLLNYNKHKKCNSQYTVFIEKN